PLQVEEVRLSLRLAPVAGREPAPHDQSQFLLFVRQLARGGRSTEHPTGFEQPSLVEVTVQIVGQIAQQPGDERKTKAILTFVQGVQNLNPSGSITESPVVGFRDQGEVERFAEATVPDALA